MNKISVIISGASGNIGFRLANLFIEKKEEYNLYLFCNKNFKKLNKFKCPIFVGDINDKNFISESIKSLGDEKKFININCIGITNDKLITKLKEEEFMEIINVNLTGIFFLIKNILNKYKKNGHIINLSSISGLQGRTGQSAYSASKGALISLTRSIAKEYGKKSIQANIVLPGFIPSKITENLDEKIIKKIKSQHILNKFQNANETAFFIYSLSKMKNVSGQIFNLDSRINT